LNTYLSLNSLDRPESRGRFCTREDETGKGEGGGGAPARSAGTTGKNLISKKKKKKMREVHTVLMACWGGRILRGFAGERASAKGVGEHQQGQHEQQGVVERGQQAIKTVWTSSL
jgi:hypothetical protein